MASVKDMPLLQDGPPPGGFAPVRFARRIPNSGPSALAIFLTAFGAFSWGMYQVGVGNKKRRYVKIIIWVCLFCPNFIWVWLNFFYLCKKLVPFFFFDDLCVS